MRAKVRTNNKGSLNLREKPSTSSTVICKIPYNSDIEVEEASNEWYKVTFNKYQGYALKKYILVDDEDGPLYTEVEQQQPTITQADLRAIYDSLKEAMKLIEGVLKK